MRRSGRVPRWKNPGLWFPRGGISCEPVGRREAQSAYALSQVAKKVGSARLLFKKTPDLLNSPVCSSEKLTYILLYLRVYLVFKWIFSHFPTRWSHYWTCMIKKSLNCVSMPFFFWWKRYPLLVNEVNGMSQVYNLKTQLKYIRILCPTEKKGIIKLERTHWYEVLGLLNSTKITLNLQIAVFLFWRSVSNKVCLHQPRAGSRC